MRFIYIWALLLSSFVTAQTDYPNLSVPFLQTTNPTTPLPLGSPWGSKSANSTNPYSDPPYTGVIRNYDFTIQRGTISPDGFERSSLLINGQFPGPLIEANWGDTIQVNVHNELENTSEGVSIHWHGLLQKASQWMDGVPGVQQCPIAPGKTFTYAFQADLYGTSWYHSHYSAQYVGGLFGPMIIYGPPTVPYDIDIGPVLLTDYYHEDYFTLVEKALGTNISEIAPKSVNNLVNGRNDFTYSGATVGNSGLTSFQFTPGKKHRLRLINAGAEGTQKFTIDGHSMTVIANDFVPVLPYETQVVTLGVGQRTDIIVEGLQHASGSYLIRSSIASCSNSAQPDAVAIVYYEHETTPHTSPWPAWTSSLGNCTNDALTETFPWFPIAADPSPATTETIEIGFIQNATGHHVFTMNNSPFRADYNSPILLLSNKGNNSYPDDPDWNVYNFGSNSSIRIVLNNPGFLDHPIHLHGHNFFVENVGLGTWDGTVVRQWNPQRRDVMMLPAFGYLVMQISADNPGAWPLHCHIAWHVSAGLYVTVLERPDDIAELNIPSIMAQTCSDWADYTNTTVVDQIDSGV